MWLVRHAHACSGSPSGDADRQVDGRGRAQLQRLGRQLAGLVAAGRLAQPAVMATSAAVRARQTAAALADAIGLPEPDVEAGLYRADADDLLAWLRSRHDGTDPVAVVGHNPTMADVVGWLVGPDAAPAGLATATVAVIELPAQRWSAVAPGTGRLVQLLQG